MTCYKCGLPIRACVDDNECPLSGYIHVQGGSHYCHKDCKDMAQPKFHCGGFVGTQGA